MATKHQLEQQLDETRADLEAERERHHRTRERETELSRQLKAANEQAASSSARANQLAEMLQRAEGETHRLRGHLEGMRYMIRLEKGLEPHEDPLPSKDLIDPFSHIGMSASQFDQSIRR